MNKNQEALDFLKDYRVEWGSLCGWDEKYRENIATLQELIDNYEKLEKALDKVCEWITDNDGWINIFGNDDWRSRFPNGVKTKENWKQWALEESEKQ